MFNVYILYSQTVGKFYTGFTSLSLDERLAYHNAKNKSFTNQATDWSIVFSEAFQTKKEAMAFERKIKKRRAKRFLDNL
jgi:putative endonuclease